MQRIKQAAVAAGAVLFACSLLWGTSPALASSKPKSGINASPSTSTTSTSTPSTSTTTTLPVAQPGWTVTSQSQKGITVLSKTMTMSSGAVMTVAEFPSSTTAFHLHVGSSDPPGGSAQAPNDAGPAISSYETSLLVAAFNGGFKQVADAGGMEVDGTVITPLVPGKAAAVIDANGSLHVGIWGQGLPTPGEPVVAVRENLGPLVQDGHATALSANPGAWGDIVGAAPNVARSALGVDAQGNVFFVGSMAALPSDLAQCMVSVGVVSAMELDINPFWVTLGVASQPGAAMASAVTGQTHAPSIFTAGWQRDYFAVLARPTVNCRLIFPEPGNVATANPPFVLCGTPSIQPASRR